ncbi:hypothetical protein HUJ05_004432 [Dendroctonus ponderosae]|nr:hypothetical protein HUJ05_004432 [Dendroctonus ponderosae]
MITDPSKALRITDLSNQDPIMELKHTVLVILKILVSTGLIVQRVRCSEAAVLMGGHRDNVNRTEPPPTFDEYYDYSDYTESAETQPTNKTDSEEIPNPSPLVLPGYNLPENIFNKGKPFYAEKDPLTGKIDLDHKSPSLKAAEGDSYEYLDDQPSDIHDKKNIDRKDGSISYGSHKQADVNQLTPNFHDFLNLPVKYNPNKYVYPLISSSYASTKIQGSVNKFHNHKDSFGVQKTTTTKKPASYHSTVSSYSYRTTQRTMATTPVSTTTTTKPTTVRRYPELTTPLVTVLNSSMSHPSFSDEYEYNEEVLATTASEKPRKPSTTQNVRDVFLTTSTQAPTNRVMSLFEQLFGDYDETVSTTQATVPPASTTTSKPASPTTTQGYYPNIHAGPIPNVLTGSNMGLEQSYEYEEDYNDENIQDSIPVENKVHANIDDLSLSVEPLKPVTKLMLVNKTLHEDKGKLEKKPIAPKPDLSKNKPFPVKSSTYSDFTVQKTTATSTTTTTTTTTTTSRPPSISPTTYRPTTPRVTSLPLGENHISPPPFNKDPIIVATQNLREKLNSEKVAAKQQPQLILQPPQDYQRPPNLPPSSTNFHIAPGQDTMSLVVGHHQSVGDGGQYVGTALKENLFDSKPFTPLFGPEGGFAHPNQHLQIGLQPPQASEATGSAVTIQPMQNSEASLAIGMPVNGMKQVPGQVMDATLETDGHVNFPSPQGQSERNKVVFPEEKKPAQSHQQHNREVLKLNSKPMYHQLPSDLTPPKEHDLGALPPRYADRPMRPPWDPRPGHFYSGKPEYVRPPRPNPTEVAFKRIDNLPNILPQFRPNTQHRHAAPPHYHFDQRLNRQPLLERPSNRPVGFFEKMGPPPEQPNVYNRYPPKNILRGPPPEDRRRLPLRVNYDLDDHRPLGPQPPQSLDEQSPMAEDRIMNEDPRRSQLINGPELNLYQTPPNIPINNRRNGNGDAEVETLQMIQAKNDKEKDSADADEHEDGDEEKTEIQTDTVKVVAKEPERESGGDKTIYKVYPVNTAPIIDVERNEPVIIGSKSEPPLYPSKINGDFDFQQQDRNEAPILKPHPRPPTFPAKFDFPYPLERPDSIRHPEAASNKISDLNQESFNYNNQWNSVNDNLESRIVTGGKPNFAPNQISATLKTYTEKPIAIAYTPTEPNLNADKYSMPNYGSPVIPEIRPGSVDNDDIGHGPKNSEITVHATMHTNPNVNVPFRGPIYQEPSNHKFNHKIDVDVDSDPVPAQLDFQAPFQASVKLDASTNQGWSVVRDKNRTTTEEAEVTTLPLATTSEFDIENFKPQLIGGFKPLYSMPDEGRKSEDIADRAEK